jgi:hypothetical protein
MPRHGSVALCCLVPGPSVQFLEPGSALGLEEVPDHTLGSAIALRSLNAIHFTYLSLPPICYNVVTSGAATRTSATSWPVELDGVLTSTWLT